MDPRRSFSFLMFSVTKNMRFECTAHFGRFFHPYEANEYVIEANNMLVRKLYLAIRNSKILKAISAHPERGTILAHLILF
jgi:hypothetical protein